jgi:hypothetical protein
METLESALLEMKPKALEGKLKDKTILAFNKEPMNTPMFDYKLSAGAPCNDPKINLGKG